MSNYRIGVDVGGTNTDAALMLEDEVVATQKMPTTSDVSSGIIAAIKSVFEQSSVTPDMIKCVMIGTTHFTNAFVERKNLLPVGIIRIAEPAAKGVPPLIDWPEDFRNVIGTHIHSLQGGYNYDGSINSELDEPALYEVAGKLKARDIKTVAITGLFSSVNDKMEQRAAQIIHSVLPKCSVTLSSSIGKMGLLERENAAIMNASLAVLSKHVVQSFKAALKALRISAPFFISQNDGTLMSADYVEKYPVLTFASGPTNSMRGAAYLSGLKDAIVADIGGTTTDIGVLSGGFPRESAVSVDIGGVRTNFRMPDIFAIGLGGGSIVKTNPISIGPQSVGYELSHEALVFGGETLTASDIAVASGYANFGDKAKVNHLDKAKIKAAVEHIHSILAEGVDRMKTSAKPVPLILVGGGSVLIHNEIPGISEVIIPKNADVANAIGASIAQIGGETDRVYSYEDLGRDKSIEMAISQAKKVAINAGAEPEGIEVTDMEELPIPYMPGEAVRLKVKVAGHLNIGSMS
ncbi:hydantoinase/oxoprolinase N-terminal domain-containing protein [Hellea balneolensis]|uniref:hydantoinase/oxoprolinase N-terminal domain-containing protein n=1 Tax=Hellea balneolensis TaxID=287478 RepID=UPI00054FB543|nr:hydantoinase/oxoprolinase family protein [Hellea balneolensis]